MSDTLVICSSSHEILLSCLRTAQIPMTSNVTWLKYDTHVLYSPPAVWAFVLFIWMWFLTSCISFNTKRIQLSMKSFLCLTHHKSNQCWFSRLNWQKEKQYDLMGSRCYYGYFYHCMGTRFIDVPSVVDFITLMWGWYVHLFLHCSILVQSIEMACNV